MKIIRKSLFDDEKKSMVKFMDKKAKKERFRNII